MATVPKLDTLLFTDCTFVLRRIYHILDTYKREEYFWLIARSMGCFVSPKYGKSSLTE